MRGAPSPTDRGQSETLGVVLILGITILGTGLVVGFGATALDGTRSSTELHQAELAMTVFDSQAATVALGDSDVQTVDFGGTAGTTKVEPTSGRITVKHVNWDGDGTDEIIYQDSLGALVYKNDGTKLVYQAGGVWRKDEGGGVSMVSPPEFHYRGATLTLPLIRVTGSASGSARSKLKVTSAGPFEQVYPDVTETYSDGSTKYTNPAENGQVKIIIESAYYEGWASYFRERTNANVIVDHANEKVTVELISTGETGYFEMPGEDSSVGVRGVEDHGMTDFEVTIRPDDTDSASFSNLKWSMYVDQGSSRFEIHVRQSGGNGCDAVASATVYYSSNDGADYQGWYDDDAFEAECGDFDDDGDQEVKLVADFVDDDDGDGSAHDDEGSDDPDLTYVDLSKSQLMSFDPDGNPSDSITFDGHSTEATWEPKDYQLNDGDTETLDRIINHYASEMNGFDLTIDDKNSNSVSEGASYGTIDYSGGNRYITYLHITENKVKVKSS